MLSSTFAETTGTHVVEFVMTGSPTDFQIREEPHPKRAVGGFLRMCNLWSPCHGSGSQLTHPQDASPGGAIRAFCRRCGSQLCQHSFDANERNSGSKSASTCDALGNELSANRSIISGAPSVIVTSSAYRALRSPPKTGKSSANLPLQPNGRFLWLFSPGSEWRPRAWSSPLFS